jgi:cell division septation protein DedD
MSATSTSQNRAKQKAMKRHGPREGSVVWAMIQVLDGTRTPMTPPEILAEIKKRRLAKKLAGKTPEASVAARLAVHVGIYFERPEKGKYLLKKGITAKSVASSSESKPKASSQTTARRPARSKVARKPTPKAHRHEPASESSQPPADATAQRAESTREPTATA